MNISLLIYKLLTYPIKKVKTMFFLRYNKFLFKMAGIKYGKNLVVMNHIHINISSKSSVNIGNNFIFTSGNSLNPLCRNIKGCIYTKKNAQIIIGNNVGISSACLWANSSITIGNNVKIGGDCIILDTDAHSLNHIHRRITHSDLQHTNNAPIVIEDDVLIGTRCIILKGVRIGARSIIGSGSVVTKDIPSDCIAAGNPCKVIRRINSE